MNQLKNAVITMFILSISLNSFADGLLEINEKGEIKEGLLIQTLINPGLNGSLYILTGHVAAEFWTIGQELQDLHDSKNMAEFRNVKSQNETILKTVKTDLTDSKTITEDGMKDLDNRLKKISAINPKRDINSLLAEFQKKYPGVDSNKLKFYLALKYRLDFVDNRTLVKMKITSMAHRGFTKSANLVSYTVMSIGAGILLSGSVPDEGSESVLSISDVSRSTPINILDLLLDFPDETYPFSYDK